MIVESWRPGNPLYDYYHSRSFTDQRLKGQSDIMQWAESKVTFDVDKSEDVDLSELSSI